MEPEAEFEEQRIRREDDESIRHYLIQWAFGDSTVKSVSQVRPPNDREEVITTLHNRDAAILLLRAVLNRPEFAEKEYDRFIKWLDSTGGECSELQDALAMYLLGIWANWDHPRRGADQLRLLVEDFKLTESEAEEVLDKYYELLPY